MNNSEILSIEKQISKWKAMARKYFHDKDYANATLCRKLRDAAKMELKRLKSF